ncbi:MAG: hypothetical protein ACPKPY_11575 [Nitrososphaeraceae archaeon]
MVNSNFKTLINEILLQDNIMFSVKSNGGICEARLLKNMPFKIKNQWATIGDKSTSWHIHINIDKLSKAKFVKEFNPSHNKNSYSIRFYDVNDDLIMRVNFVKLYDNNGNLIKEKVSKYDNLFNKFGQLETISFI